MQVCSNTLKTVNLQNQKHSKTLENLKQRGLNMYVIMKEECYQGSRSEDENFKK